MDTLDLLIAMSRNPPSWDAVRAVLAALLAIGGCAVLIRLTWPPIFPGDEIGGENAIDFMMQKMEAAKADRALRMPTVQAALEHAQDAYRRLEEMGWRDALYAPKDGTEVDTIEWGSTGIHPCHYMGAWPDGGWWLAEAGDLWPGRPDLYKSTGWAPPVSRDPTGPDRPIAASVRNIVRAAWSLCDDTEETVHADEFGEHYRVPKEDWEALAKALTDAEALIPDADQPASAPFAVTLLVREIRSSKHG